jgi:signal transduction histidine kinase
MADAIPDQRRDRILEAVARAVDRLAEPGPLAAALPDVLRLLGEATGVSRVYHFEYGPDASGRSLCSQTAEWCAPGVEPQIDNPELQGLDLVEAGFGRWVQRLSEGLSVYGDIADFPESEQPLLEVQDIRSLLVQPVLTGGLLRGLIGFDACERVQSWQPLEIDVLRIAARAIGGVLARQEDAERLRRTEQMAALGRMAGGVAHDFNNLLTVLSGTLDLARIGLEGDAEVARMALDSLDTAESTVEQATALVRRLLDFSRGREGRPQRLRLGELLDRVQPLLEQAAGSGVELVREPCRGDLELLLDPVQLEQVLLNLVVNARDAMPRGGRLWIGARAHEVPPGHRLPTDPFPGRWVRLTVRDEGVGMEPAVAEHIFEPFFTTKTSERGTGLGLATVYANVTAAGGRIAVESAPGRGTTFRIDLPCAPADEEPAARSAG